LKNSKAAARRGYTLSEVLVVLGLIVTAAALAQPALRATLGDSRLRSAARQVRTELAKTRLRAMQSGSAQRFRFQEGKNRFEVAPANFDAEAELSGASTSRRDAPDRAGQQESPAMQAGADVVVQELPDGVSFGPVAEQLTSQVDEEGWSEPIVFYPNGRAADAKIQLHGERNAVVEVSLRGLTGVATATRPRHEKADP
jgi:prepilin-type N-terminal cleavage/methylation domain-containing protein